MSIYVIGHKSPDLDSVAAAIAYANLKNKLSGGNEYAAARAGEINKETDFILKKFGLKAPLLLSDAEGQKLILVDHNELAQMVDGATEAEIIEVVDHHKFDFKSSEPIAITNKPWGASCSIVAQMYFDANVAINKNLAGLLLAAILVDTVITKSPTCAETDKKIIAKLSELSGIIDWQTFGMEIFKVRSDVVALSNEQIIKNDYKDFNLKAGKFGIGQIETVDLSELSGREDELLTELEKMRVVGNYHSVILFITDIIKEGSQFLIVSSDFAGVETALGVKTANSRVYIPGILSRKKQVLPKLTEQFDK